jgi:thioesterase domain-containing protein
LQAKTSFHQLKILWNFAPKGQGMPLHLFWTNGDQNCSHAMDLRRDDQAGEISCFEGGTTYFVAGNHFTMLQKPNVREIARLVSVALQ